MKYINKTEINRPISQVVTLWGDEKNYHQWQEGFEKIKPICGVQGEELSKSEIVLRYKKTDMKLIQTILKSNLPKEQVILVEHEHMTNTMTTRFEEVASNKTLYSTEIEYTKFNSFLPWLMAKLFPGMFRKQSQKWLDNFKQYAEKEIPPV